jgi:hypothetical protein
MDQLLCNDASQQDHGPKLKSRKMTALISMQKQLNSFENLARRASNLNRKIADNTANGDCLFLAVADQICRTKFPQSATELRSSAILNLREFPFLVSVVVL